MKNRINWIEAIASAMLTISLTLTVISLLPSVGFWQAMGIFLYFQLFSMACIRLAKNDSD